MGAHNALGDVEQFCAAAGRIGHHTPHKNNRTIATDTTTREIVNNNIVIAAQTQTHKPTLHCTHTHTKETRTLRTRNAHKIGTKRDGKCSARARAFAQSQRCDAITN